MTSTPRRENSDTVYAIVGMVTALVIIAVVIVAMVAGYGYLRELVR